TLQISLRVESYQGGFIMRPRLDAGGRWWTDECGRAPGRATVVLANDGTRWEDTFLFDCSGLRRRSGEVTQGASWRVVFVDREGRPTRPRVISALVGASRPVLTVFQGRKQWLVSGKFAADSIQIELADGRVVEARWESDPDEAHRPATHRLRVVVESHAVEPSGPLWTRSPEPEELRHEASEVEASDALTALSLELAGDPSTRWPDLVVWLRPVGEAAWQRVSVGARDRAARSALRVEIPDRLAGTDLELQITSFVEGRLESLRIVHREGASFYRVRLVSAGPTIRRVRLERPVRPSLVMRARVVDSDGAPIPDVTVAIRSFDERRRRRDLRLVESTSAMTNEAGEAVLKLWTRPGDQIWALCAKPGWTVHGQQLSRMDFDCRLDPEPEPPGVVHEDGEQPPFGVVRVVDKNGGEPIRDATVRWTWRREETPVTAVGFGDGLWGVPAPDPVPERAEIAIDAPCYEPIIESFSPRRDGPIAMSYICRTAKLSIQLVGAGPGVTVRHPERATAIVRQGERQRTLAFSSDGYSEAKSFRFDPTGGPVELEVAAPGYAVATRTFANFADQIDDSGYVPDLKITLRPAGRGLAVLLNAAETWSFYPPARDAAIRALGTSVPPEAIPDQLIVGVLGGAYEAASGDASTRLDEVLRWFGGMSASGGRLLAENLGQRLDRMTSIWPTASGWDVVVVVPHDALLGATTEPGEPAEYVAAARTWLDVLREQHVVLHIIEDGGTNPALRAFAEHLGGEHVEIDSATDPQTARDTIREHLASVSTAPGGE
ncbi:MAG: hypothetical protein AAGE94_18740, partial [Acidobacteriota bacterium]